jgi:hypothetical protein
MHAGLVRAARTGYTVQATTNHDTCSTSHGALNVRYISE